MFDSKQYTPNYLHYEGGGFSCLYSQIFYHNRFTKTFKTIIRHSS